MALAELNGGDGPNVLTYVLAGLALLALVILVYVTRMRAAARNLARSIT